MKRLNWKMLVVLVVALVLVFAMVGCNEDEPVAEVYEAFTAVSDIAKAADVTIGSLANTGKLSLGLKANIESDLKVVVDGKNVVDFSGANKINYGVKVAGNFDGSTPSSDQILAEISNGSTDVVGIYSDNNQVYIKDNFTTTSEKKLKLSGLQALNYNKYLSMFPGAVADVSISLSNLIESNKSLLEGLIDNLLVVSTKTEGDVQTVSLRLVIVSETTEADGKARLGLSSAMDLLGGILNGLSPTVSNIINMVTPYVLGGTIDDFKTAGKVTKSPTLTIDVAIDKVGGGISGLAINLDANAMSDKGITGGLKLNISDLLISSSLVSNLLPSDLSSAYTEGALTVDVDLGVVNNAALQLAATMEVSPNLNDPDMKVKLVAKKGATAVDLEAAYAQIDGQWGIAFDIGELYDVANNNVENSKITKVSNTKWFYPFEMGSFLTNLIKSQRVFVFVDESVQAAAAVNSGWLSWGAYEDFFVPEAASIVSAKAATTDTETMLDTAIANIKARFAAIYGGEASQYTVELRNKDGSLAYIAKNGAVAASGSLVSQVAALGSNVELFAMVSNSSAIAADGGHEGRAATAYSKVTFEGTNSDKVVYVKTGSSLPKYFVPNYTASAGTYANGWKIKNGAAINIDSYAVSADVTITPNTMSTTNKVRVEFRSFNIDSKTFESYTSVWFDVDGSNADNYVVAADKIPAIPAIYGMTGVWKTASAAGEYYPGSSDRRQKSAVTAITFAAGSYDKSKATIVYPVYTADISSGTSEYTANVGFVPATTETNDLANKLRAQYGKTNLIGEEPIAITSIVEAGNPSAVGQNAVSAILGDIGSYINALTSKTIDLQLVAKTAAQISPYLGNNKLFAQRIRDLLAPLGNFDRATDEVAYPIVVPGYFTGDEEDVSKSVTLATTAIIDPVNNDVTTHIDATGVSGFNDVFVARNIAALTYVRYWLFVGDYGSLNATDLGTAFTSASPNAASLPLAWSQAQIDAYLSGSLTTAAARAAQYATNEQASYSNKVQATLAKVDAAASETKALNYFKAYLGASAVTGSTVEEFFFGADGKTPLQITFSLLSAAKNKADNGTDGIGVSVEFKRKGASTAIATLSGSLFFSLASGVTPSGTDWSSAQDLTQLCVDTTKDFVLYTTVADRADKTDVSENNAISKAEYVAQYLAAPENSSKTEADALAALRGFTYDELTASISDGTTTYYINGSTSVWLSKLVFELKAISNAMIA